MKARRRMLQFLVLLLAAATALGGAGFLPGDRRIAHAASLEIRQNVPGNIFYENENKSFTIATDGEWVDWSYVDYWGNLVESGSLAVTDGAAVLTVNPGKYGWFKLMISAKQEEGSSTTKETSFAVVSQFDLSQVEDSLFSVQTHAARTDSIAQDANKLIPIAAKLGVKYIRDSLRWEDIEDSAKGEYTFKPFHDHFMNLLSDYHLKPFITLALYNQLYDEGLAPRSEEGRMAYAEYGKQVLGRYPQISQVEIWNEPDIPSFSKGLATEEEKADFYANLLKTSYEQIHPAYPDVKITGFVFGGLGSDALLESLYEKGALQYMNEYSFHSYNRNPENFVADIERHKTIMKKYNHDQTIPIHLSETGFTNSNFDEHVQAHYLPRRIVTALANGVEKINIYNLQNKATGSEYEDGFGMVRHPNDEKGAYTPKPVFSAYAALTRQLTGATFQGSEDIAPGLSYIHRFKKGDEDIRVMYSPFGAEFKLHSSSSLEVTDMMGNTQTLAPLDGVIHIGINEHPIYVKGTVDTIEEVIPVPTSPVTLTHSFYENGGYTEVDGPLGTSTNKWVTSSVLKGYDGVKGSRAITNPTGASVTWKPTISIPGKYKVSVYLPGNPASPYNTTRSANYSIYIDGVKVATKDINQFAQQGTWVDLGIYDFARNRNDYVLLEDGSAAHDKPLRADVAKFELIPLESIALDAALPHLKVGETQMLTPTLAPTEATDQTLVWTSSDDQVAAVDELGQVNGLHAGTAVIRVTNPLTALYAETVVNVEKVEAFVSIDRSQVTLLPGESTVLTARVLPEDAPDRSVTWTVEDESIASVDSHGTVVGLKPGQTKVRASSAIEGVYAESIITVEAPAALEPIILNYSYSTGVGYEEVNGPLGTATNKWVTSTVLKGYEGGISRAITNPVGASARWTPAITVPGRYRISVYLPGTPDTPAYTTQNALYSIYANGALQEKKELNQHELQGSWQVLGVYELPAGTDSYIELVDGNEAHNRPLRADVVRLELIPMTGLTLDLQSLELAAGTAHPLTATFTPAEATDPQLIWSSSDQEVAVVDPQGQVTGVSAGTAKIRVVNPLTSLYAEIQVTVTGPHAAAVIMNPGHATLKPGEWLALTALVLPNDSIDQSVTWSVYDGSIASVDGSGKVTALQPGQTSVRASVTQSVYAEAVITVEPDNGNPGGENPGGQEPPAEQPSSDDTWGGEQPPAEKGQEVAVNLDHVVVKGIYDETSGTVQARLDAALLEKAGGLPDSSGTGSEWNIDITPAAGAASYRIELAKSLFADAQQQGSVRVGTELAMLKLPVSLLQDSGINQTESWIIDIRAVPTDSLHAGIRTAVAGRPVREIRLLDGHGKTIGLSSPADTVKISIPYSLQTGEDGAKLSVWQWGEDGEHSYISTAYYDLQNRKIRFEAAYSGSYAIVLTEKSFSDLKESEWARQAVEALASKGIIQGISDSTFAPAAPVTRADFVMLLVRAFGWQDNIGGREASTGSFADVDASAYYCKAVETARRLGILQGTETNHFLPASLLTRQDMAVLAARALEAAGGRTGSGSSSGLSSFSDYQDIADYAKESMELLAGAGFMEGDGEHMAPRASTTRAEAAVLIHRLYTFIAEQQDY